MDINIHGALAIGIRQTDNCVVFEIKTKDNGTQEVSVFWDPEAERFVGLGRCVND